MLIRVPKLAALLMLLIVAAPSAAGADWDLSLHAGQAYPTFDERLVIRIPNPPPVAGLTIDAMGTPEIRGSGGLVVGGSLAREFGVFALEGRVDVVEVAVEFSGTQYDLRFSPPVFGATNGRITVGDVRFDSDRLNVFSLNARLRTPGPLAIMASGGVSYLPGFEATGTVPIGFQLQGLGGVGQPQLRVRVDPEESEHRFGVNGGAGLRIGGRIGVFAEARVFYFKSYELALDFDDAQPFVNVLLDQIDPVRFRPVIVNATGGISIRFP